MGIMLGARIVAGREIGNKSIRILTDSRSALLAPRQLRGSIRAGLGVQANAFGRRVE